MAKKKKMTLNRVHAHIVLAMLDVAEDLAPEHDWKVQIVTKGKRVTYDLFTWVDDDE